MGRSGVPDAAALIADAVEARRPLLDPHHEAAVRLFDGFAEGPPRLVIELFARTLVLHDHGEAPGDEAAARDAVAAVRSRLGWVRAALWKLRRGAEAERRGRLLLGGPRELDRRIREHGVRYALALDRLSDGGFFLDTRELRAWARASLTGARVLNAFAYTGSLGVAARAGGARQVLHVDRSRAALDVAKASCALNGFEVRRTDFVAADFFELSARLRRSGDLFDCVLLDPPFFADSGRGRVDLQHGAERLLDKAWPLVGDGGWLVAVNDALWVSGAEWLATLERVCRRGFGEVERLLPVPADVSGAITGRHAELPADPAPFGHPTKIAVVRVRRKDGRRA